MQQWPPRQKTVTKTEEDEEYEGGINIDKAKEFMSEEDKHDKVAFRQRVKEKHKVKAVIVGTILKLNCLLTIDLGRFSLF